MKMQTFQKIPNQDHFFLESFTKGVYLRKRKIIQKEKSAIHKGMVTKQISKLSPYK